MLTHDGAFTGDSDVAIAIAIKHVTQPMLKLPDLLTGILGTIDRMTHKDPGERFHVAEVCWSR